MGLQADTTIEKLVDRFGFRLSQAQLSTVVVEGAGHSISLYDFMDSCLLLSLRTLDDGVPALIFGSKTVSQLMVKLVGVEKAKLVMKHLAENKAVEDSEFSVVIDKYANKHKPKR